MPPARATVSHSSGAPSSPARLKGVVKMTGSGFHDGPVLVIRSRWATSRPQMIHAHGSYVGTLGSSKLRAASAKQTSTSSFHGLALGGGSVVVSGGGANRSSTRSARGASAEREDSAKVRVG